MTTPDPDLLLLARRYVWWQEPEATLAEPRVLLWQILSLGTPDDYVLAVRHFGELALREALAQAPHGAVDARSRAFWARRFGLELPAETRRSFA